MRELTLDIWWEEFLRNPEAYAKLTENIVEAMEPENK